MYRTVLGREGGGEGLTAVPDKNYGRTMERSDEWQPVGLPYFTHISLSG